VFVLAIWDQDRNALHNLGTIILDNTLLKDVECEQVPQEPVRLIKGVPVWHRQQLPEIRLAKEAGPFDGLHHITHLAISHPVIEIVVEHRGPLWFMRNAGKGPLLQDLFQ
jgi:hypothetical protein